MSNPSAEEIGLKVGFEVHQQLATGRKLFCSCPIIKTEEFPFIVRRRLRPTQSELGHIDPAAIFEFLKGKSNVYKWNPESSCLVELDEEPPHLPNEEAIDSAILIALTLSSEVMDEIHVMRKVVIDGSNTSGFQRTAIIALGGYLEFQGRKIGVQAVTLEEDAARIVGEDEKARYFALDRLGVPLVEISLEPVTASPAEIEEIALSLGRTLRSTRKVARGLGTIRQDLNISVSGGNVVEVKGVQKLELISKVVEYEMKRQHGLILIANKIRERGIEEIETSWSDIPSKYAELLPEKIRKMLLGELSLVCIIARGLAGVLGYEPYPNIRLGKELAEVARANSIGGIVHSDEFEKLGINKEFESELRKFLDAKDIDALVLFACSQERKGDLIEALTSRLKFALNGVPPETRGPTHDGETRYMRPRPGAERMYPETDIPEIVITKERIERISKQIPRSWEEIVNYISDRYKIRKDTSLKLYDEGKVELFSEIAENTNLPGPYIASVLLDVSSWAIREGADESRLTDWLFKETLGFLKEGKIPKEAVQEIILKVGKGEANSPKEAIEKFGFRLLSEEEIVKLVESVVTRKHDIIAKKGEGAFSALMGEIMRETRGKADGEKVAKLLKKKIREIIRG
jgi:glutamyl-tRNA(Gln) amidotransferase subunit E